MYGSASGAPFVTHALPPRPPRQSPLPPPPLPKHLELTIAEQLTFSAKAYNIHLLDFHSEGERNIAWKMLPTTKHRDELTNKLNPFPMPRDTAFMLGPAQATINPPIPTDAYWARTHAAWGRSDHAEPKLLILDLNSTLLFRPNPKTPARYHERAHLQGFLQYIFKEFKVMIWSSARPDNVRKMVTTLIPESLRPFLVAVWARDTLRLTPLQYNEKTQVYKQLEWVWQSLEVNAHHPGFRLCKGWDQYNTILIDDSALKALANPCNLLLVPSFSGPGSDDHFKKGSVLQQVAGYLEIARLQSNVSAYMQANPFKIDVNCYWMPLGETLARTSPEPTGHVFVLPIRVLPKKVKPAPAEDQHIEEPEDPDGEMDMDCRE